MLHGGRGRGRGRKGKEKRREEGREREAGRRCLNDMMQDNDEDEIEDGRRKRRYEKYKV